MPDLSLSARRRSKAVTPDAVASSETIAGAIAILAARDGGAVGFPGRGRRTAFARRWAHAAVRLTGAQALAAGSQHALAHARLLKRRTVLCRRHAVLVRLAATRIVFLTELYVGVAAIVLGRAASVIICAAATQTTRQQAGDHHQKEAAQPFRLHFHPPSLFFCRTTVSVHQLGRVENGVEFILPSREALAAAREEEIDHLRLPGKFAIGYPLQAAYVVRLLRVGFAELHALDAVDFKVAQLVHFAVLLARRRAVVISLEADGGRKALVHR